ncbi:MAG: hypothetical protein IJH38_08385 [Clostridia bacterium]|nr:hypothetical protein [Clostridia bacterium]
MKKAEYPGNEGCPQRNSAEHEEYAGARSADRQETEETDGADLLERILSRGNLKRAYKRVLGAILPPSLTGVSLGMRNLGEGLMYITPLAYWKARG